MQMTTNGTGVYYKPGIELGKGSQIMGDIGVHLDNHLKSVSMFDMANTNSSIYLDISAVLRKELLKDLIVSVFRPIFILQGGSIADGNTISGINNLGNWKLKFAIGTGVQFYNGRILNELILKYDQNPFSEGYLAFQLAMYWK